LLERVIKTTGISIFMLPRDNQRPATIRLQTLSHNVVLVSHNVVLSSPRHERDSNSQRYWLYALIDGYKWNTNSPFDVKHQSIFRVVIPISRHCKDFDYLEESWKET
jgi:broad specificity phosphatase PhoE